MVNKILKQMSEVVNKKMTSFKSDFEKYDTEYIAGEGVKAFPFLWLVSPTHTYLIKLASFREDYFGSEAWRYSTAQMNSWYHACLYPDSKNTEETIYYVTLDGLREVSVDEARAIFKEVVDKTVAEWEQENGKMPTKFKISVEIGGTSLERLKELIQDCRNHGNDSLMSCLKRFRIYSQIAKNHKIAVWYNESSNEFSFCEYVNGKARLRGGIVFHGWSETGYKTNNSIQLEPEYGWHLHT